MILNAITVGDFKRKGGRTLESAQCTKCWGSGNHKKPWPSVRMLRKKLAAANQRVQRCRKGWK